MAQGGGGSGPGPCRRAVVRLVRVCESWAADAAEGAIGVDTARVDAEWGGCLRLVTLIDVNAGHAGHVQAVAVEAVAGEALGDPHAAAVGTTVQDPALLRL